MRVRGWVSSVSLILFMATSVVAEPLSRDEVPTPLRPWIDWALRGEKDAPCPFIQSKGEHRQCVWPSRLHLTLTNRGGEFRQEWWIYRDAWVPLPGDAKIWPQSGQI